MKYIWSFYLPIVFAAFVFKQRDQSWNLQLVLCAWFAPLISDLGIASTWTLRVRISSKCAGAKQWKSRKISMPTSHARYWFNADPSARGRFLKENSHVINKSKFQHLRCLNRIALLRQTWHKSYFVNDWCALVITKPRGANASTHRQLLCSLKVSDARWSLINILVIIDLAHDYCGLMHRSCKP